MNTDLFEKIVALAKRRGFIYPGSEIYGGLANTYDYGPMGAELLRNIRNTWWKMFVHDREDIVGIDASIISSHRIWEASGHTANFADALIDCKECRLRIRADHLIEDWLEANANKFDMKQAHAGYDFMTEGLNNEVIEKALSSKKVEGLSPQELTGLIAQFKIPCPKCKKFNWTDVRRFNQLFPVSLGIVEGDDASAYLRGETAQSIFINFKNIVDSNRVRLPFGIAQIGKSFRNEITLGNSIFRTIEFEQGEIEYFFDPNMEDWEQLFEDWKSSMWRYVTDVLGIQTENLRWRMHSDEERSFYSKRTEDLEYNFPFGFKELWGLAYRTDYDLGKHSFHSGKELSIVDPNTNKKIIPHVIEPAVGINRLMLMVLCDAFREEEGRVFLKLSPKMAPYKAAVFPLLANKPELVEKAREIYVDLKDKYMIAWDERGNIGKRYASQDEIGTPFCITVDFQTLEDNTVTVRDRDSAQQERIEVSQLVQFLTSKI
jgi:glycyl-tRNA synthetase